MSDNIITLNKEVIHTELKDLVRNSVEETLNSLLDAEADRLVNADDELGAGGAMARFSNEGHKVYKFTITNNETQCVGSVHCKFGMKKSKSFSALIVEVVV